MTAGLLDRLRQRHRRVLAGTESGMSLIELLVGMTLMMVFLSMFTGAVIMMNRAENKAQAVNLTSTRLNTAFHVLDEALRYAAAISSPGKSAGPGTTGNWYVEFRTTNTGTHECTQLRIDMVTQQLQQRTWEVIGSTPSSLTLWMPISAAITNGGVAIGSTEQPFVLKAPNSSVTFQQLTVNLVSPSGSGSTQTTSRSTFSVTAINSVIPTPTGSICQEVGRP